jgi:hypothetical protein
VPNVNFYRELKKDKFYPHLVPSQEAGLVIVLLYDQWKTGKFDDNSFAEEAVMSAVQEVDSDLGKTTERTPWQRFKEINITLQQYFLLRNEETNRYKISQYGIEFCENIKRKLEREFNPSDIEKIVANLISLLKEALVKKDFEFWYQHQFNKQRSTFKNQVETLLRQVDVAVKEFRFSTLSDDDSFLETVKRVDESLQVVSEHANELRDAFFDTDDLKALLLQMPIDETTDDLVEHKEDVRKFLLGIQDDLNIINRRIERIRPKLRQFIAGIHQRTFDRNTESFLKHLLNNSAIVSKSGKKQLQLPEGIERKAIFGQREKFIIVEGGRLAPKVPTPVVKPVVDTQKRLGKLKETQDSLKIRRQVSYWLKELDLLLSDDDELGFSEFYFKILSEEAEFAKTIATRVASKAVTKYSKLKMYQVEVDQTLTADQEHKNVAIWKMTIRKRGK